MKVFVKAIEERVSSTGKTFWSLDTNQGKMSIWDSGIATEIKDVGVQREFELNVEEKGNFKNVTGITGQKTEKVSSEGSSEPKTAITGNNAALLCMQYAKDLAVAGKIEVSNIRTEATGFMNLYNELKDK